MRLCKRERTRVRQGFQDAIERKREISSKRESESKRERERRGRAKREVSVRVETAGIFLAS